MGDGIFNVKFSSIDNRMQFHRHNRQFRFEERDKEGVVKGQFGYYDKEGKFRMMNYNAHPLHGYHMEPAPESEVRE